MKEYIFKNFELNYPYVASRVVKWECGTSDITATLDDGKTIYYDDFDRSIRILPKYKYYTNEQECRTEFGIRLRRRMLVAGMTQNDLAEATGLSQPTISSCITGKQTPNYYTVDRIARALGCSMDEFRYVNEDGLTEWDGEAN